MDLIPKGPANHRVNLQPRGISVDSEITRDRFSPPESSPRVEYTRIVQLAENDDLSDVDSRESSEDERADSPQSVASAVPDVPGSRQVSPTRTSEDGDVILLEDDAREPKAQLRRSSSSMEEDKLARPHKLRRVKRRRSAQASSDDPVQLLKAPAPNGSLGIHRPEAVKVAESRPAASVVQQAASGSAVAPPPKLRKAPQAPLQPPQPPPAAALQQEGLAVAPPVRKRPLQKPPEAVPPIAGGPVVTAAGLAVPPPAPGAPKKRRKAKARAAPAPAAPGTPQPGGTVTRSKRQPAPQGKAVSLTAPGAAHRPTAAKSSPPAAKLSAPAKEQSKQDVPLTEKELTELRSAVLAQLKRQLGNDLGQDTDVLVEYIVVLADQRKHRTEMLAELSFLKEQAEPFVSWLEQYEASLAAKRTIKLPPRSVPGSPPSALQVDDAPPGRFDIPGKSYVVKTSRLLLQPNPDSDTPAPASPRPAPVATPQTEAEKKRVELLAEMTRRLQVILSKLSDKSLDDAGREKYQLLAQTVQAQIAGLSRPITGRG